MLMISGNLIFIIFSFFQMVFERLWIHKVVVSNMRKMNGSFIILVFNKENQSYYMRSNEKYIVTLSSNMLFDCLVHD